MAKALGFGFARALVDAGLLTEDELSMTRRVVIDYTAGEVPRLYIEKFGDDAALAKLAPMLEGLIPRG